MAEGIFYTLGLKTDGFTGPVKKAEQTLASLNSGVGTLEATLGQLPAISAAGGKALDSTRSAAEALATTSHKLRDKLAAAGQGLGGLDSAAPAAASGVGSVTKALEPAARAATGFEAAIEELSHEMEALPGSARVSEAAMKNFEQESSRSGMSLLMLAGRLKGMSMAGAVAGGATALAGYALVKLVQSSSRAAAAMEPVEVAFETLTGSAERARAVLGALQALGAETPYDFEELAVAGRNLIAFGEGAHTVTETLRRIGDVASGIQAPLADIATIYGKARVQQTLFAEDINQLVGRGIPVIAEFAAQLGVSEAEVKKLASEGQITFDMLEQAFRDLTGEGAKFGGMMEKQARTMKGYLGGISDQWNSILTDLGRPINDTIMKPLLSGVEEFVAGMARGVAGLTTDVQAAAAATREMKIEAEEAAVAAEERARAEAEVSREIQRQEIDYRRQQTIAKNLEESARRRAALLRQATESRDRAASSAQERIYEITHSEEDNLKRKIGNVLQDIQKSVYRHAGKVDLKGSQDVNQIIKDFGPKMPLEYQGKIANQMADLVEWEARLKELKEDTAKAAERGAAAEQAAASATKQNATATAKSVGRMAGDLPAGAAEPAAAEGAGRRRIRLYNPMESLHRRLERMSPEDQRRGFTSLDRIDPARYIGGDRGRFAAAAGAINARGNEAMSTARPAAEPRVTEIRVQDVPEIRAILERIDRHFANVTSA